MQMILREAEVTLVDIHLKKEEIDLKDIVKELIIPALLVCDFSKEEIEEFINV